MPNQLQPDDATFETSVGNWVSLIAGWTIARVTSPTPHAGTGVLEVTADGSQGDTPSLTGPTPPCVYGLKPGETVTFSVWVRADAGNAHPGEYACGTTTNVYDAAPSGSTIDQEYSGGGVNTRISSAAWTEVTVTFVAPVSSVWADWRVFFGWEPDLDIPPTAPEAGDIFYVSDAYWDGTPTCGGGWSVGSIRIA